jgi:hypothetical protein
MRLAARNRASSINGWAESPWIASIMFFTSDIMKIQAGFYIARGKIQ